MQCRGEWGLIARSSNYELYGDMSNRVIRLLQQYSAVVEIYSIDEAFLEVRGTLEELTTWARDVKARIWRDLGLPVCVGVASSKTLAKLANRWAKKVPALGGVCIWDAMPAPRREELLRALPVDEVWGIAGRLSKRLNAIGIESVAALRDADPARIRERFSVVLMRTVLELRGVPCMPVETQPQPIKDQLIFSRSFSEPVTTRDQMEQVLGTYAQRASTRLQKHDRQAKVITAWAMTSYFNPSQSHGPSVTVPLPWPTADPVLLTKATKKLLPLLHEGVRYARAGVMVTDLRTSGLEPALNLFTDAHEDRRIGPLIEQIRTKTRQSAIGLGRAGMKAGQHWEMRRDMMSPRYTTHWDELPIVRA